MQTRTKHFLLCVGGLMVMHAGLARADSSYSSTMLGPLGLNTVPSARLDKAGTLTAGVSNFDPYTHAWLGVQLADPLYINIRQSAQGSGLRQDADRMYPGVDMKLRLLSENDYRPEIALGMNSIIGHKRMAGEYLAFSKRYNDFDFTAGLGWGRMAGKGLLTNPFKFLGHFGQNRAADGEMPNEPSNWFTGDQIGLFGGVEYFTPINGLSLKLDYNNDPYEAEHNAFAYKTPAPWSVGASYQPFEFVSLGVAAQGTDKIMGRVTFKLDPASWKNNQESSEPAHAPMRPYRTGLALPVAMEDGARREGVVLQDATIESGTTSATIDLDPSDSTPRQYGIAARNMADHAGKDVEDITLSPFIMNLRGPSIKILRADLERALAHKAGSADEIWQHTGFNDTDFADAPERKSFFAPWRQTEIGFLLDNKISLAEEDAGLLYRTALVADMRAPIAFGALTTGTALRINLSDNLDELGKTRPFDPLGARGNVDDFTNKRVTLDKAWLGWTHSFTPVLHVALIGGYLEEMYAGYGGEVLYRPFGPRYAVGAEGWHVFKRDPYTTSSMALDGQSTFTGFLNGWYDVPGIDATLKLKAGRFLAGDTGGELSLQKIFENGFKLEGFVAVSNQADFDPFGGTTHAYNGIRLTIPFHHKIGHQRITTATRLEAAPFGRDAAQSLETPMPLYELTEPFSYRHMEQHWHDITND